MAKSARQGSRSRLFVEMNVTPFVDVALVLLIIFMVVTPAMIREVDVPVTLDPSTAPENERQIRILLFDPQMVVMNGRILRHDQLSTELFGGHDPASEVVVKASSTLSYGHVGSVLKACRDAGFENVVLVATRRG
ncbi:MAG: biopolymer transporter ExbD [Acidobacteria bacterium]|nr:biopolymer transporter ExbD [Acidobacteriota bacterium]